MRPRGKHLLFRAGLGLLLLAGTLLLLEGGLRAWQWWRPVWFLPGGDRLQAMRGRPHDPFFNTRLNSLGYNDEEFSAEIPRRHRRIAAIADSFGFGVVPRPHNVFTLLEQQLRVAGAGVEVCNLSVTDIGPREYLRQLRETALPLAPDLVVCLFYIGNDFTDGQPPAYLPYPLRLARLARGIWQDDRAAVAGYRDASLLLATVDYLRVAAAAGPEPEACGDTVPSLPADEYRAVRLAESEIFRADGELLPRLAREQAERLWTMREAVRLAGRGGFLVVLAPQELQVYPGLQRELHGDTSGYDYQLPNRVLGELLRERGIACLDLLPAFAAAAAGQALYKPRDTHWNIAGNQLAAELLARHIAEQQAALFRPPEP